MKKSFIILLLCTLSLWGCKDEAPEAALSKPGDASYSITTVDGQFTGMLIDSAGQGVSLKNNSVAIDTNGAIILSSLTPGSSINAKIHHTEKEALKEALEKGLKWSETAKRDKDDIEKEIKSFEKSYSDFASTGTSIHFLSTDNARQVNIVLRLVDENSGMPRDLYLFEKDVKQLISLIEEAPAVLEEARKNESKYN